MDDSQRIARQDLVGENIINLIAPAAHLVLLVEPLAKVETGGSGSS
jgi:hypothetical protein